MVAPPIGFPFRYHWLPVALLEVSVTLPPVQNVVGPLVVRLLDAADPTKVVAERTIPVGVANAGDYLRVVEARFEPPGPSNDGKARLAFKVRAVAPIVGTARTVAALGNIVRALGLAIDLVELAESDQA